MQSLPGGGHTRLVGGDDLEAQLGNRHWCVVDCRFDLMNPDAGRAAYEAGHIPGAVHAHLDRDLAAPVGPETGRHPLPDPSAFVDTARGWGISDDSQVVAYDDGSGAIAARLWWLLRWVGHERVAVLDGGLEGWRREQRALSDATPEVPVGKLTVRRPLERILHTDELARGLGDDAGPLLVDAREPQRFAGVSEPIDAVAGHVPGAVNFPFARNIGEDGRWLSPAALRARWEEALGGRMPANWAVMCGSGVTACHLALSAGIAGLPAPRLYAGSFSEWIRDPGRPVAGS